MSVKIFLPAELFYNRKQDCDIFGDIQVNKNNVISYFVIATSASNSGKQVLRHLGRITKSGSEGPQVEQGNVTLNFAYDSETPNIYLHQLNIEPASKSTHVNVFLYEPESVLKLHNCAAQCKANHWEAMCGDNALKTRCDDMCKLFQLLQAYKQFNKTTIKEGNRGANMDLLTQAFVMLMESKPIKYTLRKTVLYEHFEEWKKLRATGFRNANIALDKILGICVMLVLLFLIPEPGDYLIKASHLVIKHLRQLLRALKGSPVGLKLNVHLNNFFLDYFNYHTDLWAKFLDLIEPIVRQLFVPIALLGYMGLSYQLALLADLIYMVGLHAHCFYIYSAVLYKVEIKGLQVLWKVVLGKRWNLLKTRVESHNYMNRQLYLSTIFFTTLLFLFPTVLVYYSVFTCLRFCIFLLNSMMKFNRRSLLEFPLRALFKWATGNFFEIESLKLQYTPHVTSTRLQQALHVPFMSVFQILVQSSSFGRVISCESDVLKEVKTDEQQRTLKGIFMCFLDGTF